MGLSRAFSCFKDPEAQALKKPKKARKRIHNEKAQPSRVIAVVGSGGEAGIGSQARIEIQNPPEKSPLPTTTTMQNCEPSPSVLGDDEPEPWTVGAVIRRTSLLQARIAEAANEKKQTKEEADVLHSRARLQATVEEDGNVPTGETRPEVITEEKEDKQTSTGETTSTVNITNPSTRKEREVDLRATEEEAENRRRVAENARAAKGSHNGKYGGAINWNQAYSQRAIPNYSNDRDTRKSGWGVSGLSGSFGPAMDEPYCDYEADMSSGSASNSYSLPNGYGQKRNSHYAYVSSPLN